MGPEMLELVRKIEQAKRLAAEDKKRQEKIAALNKTLYDAKLELMSVLRMTYNIYLQKFAAEMEQDIMTLDAFPMNIKQLTPMSYPEFCASMGMFYPKM
jgi:hypothetical protein